MKLPTELPLVPSVKTALACACKKASEDNLGYVDLHHLEYGLRKAKEFKDRCACKLHHRTLPFTDIMG